MEFHSFVIVILSQFLVFKIGSASNEANDLSIEETVLFLKDKITQMELMMSSFELSLAVQDSQKGCLEEKNEILKKVSEVEMRCSNISAKLQDAEARLLKMEVHLLLEVQQEKEKTAQALERVKMNETRVTVNSSAATHRDTENTIGENISPLTEKLRQLNDSLSSRFESLTTKMGIFENSLLAIEKDYANISYVSKLDKSLQDIDKRIKTDIQSIQSEKVKQKEGSCPVCSGVAVLNETQERHSSRISDLLGFQSCNTEDLKEYEGLDIPTNKITEHSKTLDIQCRGGYVIASTSLACLNGTWNVTDNPCIKEFCDGKPPSVPNGKTMYFKRKLGSRVEYECNRNYVPTGNSTVQCNGGRWVGEPPVCSFFDATFFLWTWTTWDSYYCYSKDSYQKIDFSRELDTGSGRHLPGGFTKSVSTGHAVFKFGKGTLERGGPFGAFQCGYSDERTSMNVVVHRQDVASGLYFSDPFKVANIGDTVDLKVNFKKGYSIRWRHNGSEVPSWNDRENVEIPSVQPVDAGTYECYYDGKRGETASALLRLTVRKCKENQFGKHCDQQCPPCYNGGICHDQLGICICQSGFYGDNCENVCSKNRHGVNCSVGCFYIGCKLSLFCHPDPLGCACARGWKGVHCNEPCARGWYGADCKQPCHCTRGPQHCDRETGACSGGCSYGWSGQSCQIEAGR